MERGRERKIDEEREKEKWRGRERTGGRKRGERERETRERERERALLAGEICMNLLSHAKHLPHASLPAARNTPIPACNSRNLTLL